MRFRCSLALAAALSIYAGGLQSEAPGSRDTLATVEAAQRRLQQNPNAEENTLTLASLYLKLGQNRAAVETLKQYLQSHADAPKSLRMLALAYLRQEDYTAAKDSAERALRFGTRDSAVLQVLGMAELGLQSTEAAERDLAEALKLDGNSPEANLQLGLLWAKERRNLPEAIRLLEKARSLEPKVAGTYAALGSAYLASRDPNKAISNLETAIKLAPQTAEPYYLLATARRQLHEEGKADEALAAFNSRKKAEADRRASEMRARAEYEEGVNLLSNSDDLDKAYVVLQKAAIEMPTFDPAYYRLAQASYLKGDLPNALTSIREALKLNPLEPEYYFVLARCLEDKDPKAALAAIEKAISMRPGVPDFEELRRELRSKAGQQPPG
jgi:tetratricopeptide (TPR) repeat protein